ncbi:MAG: NAD(P)-dependent oxidoreductase [Lentisphaeria bacterium]|jgi:phosphoglycerate dehydrogenase-like enzyme|nr:NAD(P)-dependent oxidoreductase [Lentisphaeria bacterium]MDP7741751.1 NAD(P)-dependent oxidoreductase [Lentisphaeria bacterium]
MTIVPTTKISYAKATAVFEAAAADGLDCRCVDEPEADIAAGVRQWSSRYAVVGVHPFVGAIYEAMPRGGVLARFGVGYDNIDLDKATAAGIIVTNTPGVLSHAVAEFTIYLLLSIANGEIFHGSSGQSFEWQPVLRPAELRGKTLVVAGCGAIGNRVARTAALGLRMNVVGVEVCDFDEEAFKTQYGYSRIVREFDEVADAADYVTLHVPSLPATRHFIDASRLQAMKPGAWLINTARGPVVDEVALYDALAARTIGGAAVDVYAAEPYVPAADGKDLRTLPNIIMTPHVGSATPETCVAMAQRALQNVKLAMAESYGQMDIVNPAVLEEIGQG